MTTRPNDPTTSSRGGPRLSPSERTARRIVLVLALFAVVAGGVLAYGAWSVCQQGFATVEVDAGGARGAHVSVAVPVALLRAGAALVPRVVSLPLSCIPSGCDLTVGLARGCPLRGSAPSGCDLPSLIAPLRAALREIGRLPDGAIVELATPYENVRVGKTAGTLEVDVLGDQGAVRVRVPLGAVAPLLDRPAGEAVLDAPVLRPGATPAGLREL